MRVTVRGNTLPPLPPKEFELLHLLMLNAGRLCRRDALIARVWGLDQDSDSQTLNVHILRLRKKLEADPSQPTYIRTLRGVGYLFDT
jgi:two-component system response regulator RegX3